MANQISVNSGTGNQQVTVTSTGNIQVTTSRSVIGTVANVASANYANYAGNVTGANQPNITTVGTLSNLTVSNTITTNNLVVTGNFSVGNLVANNANYANFANVANTANTVVGSNVTGQVSYAAVANSVALANVSGAGNIASINLDGNLGNVLYGNGVFAAISSPSNVANANYSNFAGTAFSVSGSNVSGTVANANYSAYANIAATANSVAVANVSGIGNIATVNLDGNASNILHGDGSFGPEAGNLNANYANFAGNVVNATQSNITTLGTLTTLNMGGNITTNGYNIQTTDGAPGGNGLNINYTDANSAGGGLALNFNRPDLPYFNGVSINQNGTQVWQYDGGNSSYKAWIFEPYTNDIVNYDNSNFNIGSGLITAGNIQLQSGAEIRSYGNINLITNSGGGNILIDSLGNISNVNKVTANFFSGDGSNISNIAGANITGTVANANYASYAGNATYSDDVNPAGSNTQIQFNDGSGNLGASANLTFNTANTLMTVSGNVSVAQNVSAANLTLTADFSNGSFPDVVPLKFNNYSIYGGTPASIQAYRSQGNITNPAPLGVGNPIFSIEPIGENDNQAGFAVRTGFGIGGALSTYNTWDQGTDGQQNDWYTFNDWQINNNNKLGNGDHVQTQVTFHNDNLIFGGFNIYQGYSPLATNPTIVAQDSGGGQHNMTFGNDGNLTIPEAYIGNSVHANYLYGNGSNITNFPLAGGNGAVQLSNGGGAFTSGNLSYDTSNDTLNVGGNSVINAARTNLTGQPGGAIATGIDNVVNCPDITFSRHDNNAYVNNYSVYRARGTIASPADVQPGDSLFQIYNSAYSNSSAPYAPTGTFSCLVNTNDNAGNITINTSYSASVPTGSTFSVGYGQINLQGNANVSGNLKATGSMEMTTGFLKMPTYTSSALTAITGQVGWMAAVSNSAGGSNPNGMIAFWDTTNSRWSYVHDNSAV